MTRLRLIAAASVAAAALAGCGGDDENNQALSYSEFGTRANEICSDANSKIEPLSDRLTGDPGNDAPIIEDIIAEQEPAVEEFRQLEPPDELRADFDEFVSISERQLELAREAQAAAEGGDAQAYRDTLEELGPLDEDSDAAASRLGAAECANN